MTPAPRQSTAPVPAPSRPGRDVYGAASKGEMCYRLKAEKGLSWLDIGVRARRAFGGTLSAGAANSNALRWARNHGAPWPPQPGFKVSECAPPLKPELETERGLHGEDPGAARSQPRSRTKSEYCYRLRAEEGPAWDEVGRRAKKKFGGSDHGTHAKKGARRWALRHGAPWPLPIEGEGLQARRTAAEQPCAFCGDLFMPRARRGAGVCPAQVYCGKECLRASRNERARSRYAARVIEPQTKAGPMDLGILAPAHCGWCGRGIEAGLTHCNDAHRARHEQARAELAEALESFTPKEALGLSERSARRAAC